MTIADRIPTDTWVLPRPRPDAYVGGFPLHFERRLWEVLGKPAKFLHPFGGLCRDRRLRRPERDDDADLGR